MSINPYSKAQQSISEIGKEAAAFKKELNDIASKELKHKELFKGFATRIKDTGRIISESTLDLGKTKKKLEKQVSIYQKTLTSERRKYKMQMKTFHHTVEEDLKEMKQISAKIGKLQQEVQKVSTKADQVSKKMEALRKDKPHKWNVLKKMIQKYKTSKYEKKTIKYKRKVYSSKIKARDEQEIFQKKSERTKKTKGEIDAAIIHFGKRLTASLTAAKKQAKMVSIVRTEGMNLEEEIKEYKKEAGRYPKGTEVRKDLDETIAGLELNRKYLQEVQEDWLEKGVYQYLCDQYYDLANNPEKVYYDRQLNYDGQLEDVNEFKENIKTLKENFALLVKYNAEPRQKSISEKIKYIPEEIQRIVRGIFAHRPSSSSMQTEQPRKSSEGLSKKRAGSAPELLNTPSALRAFRTDLKKGNIEINESTPPDQLKIFAKQVQLALLDKYDQAKEGGGDDKKSLREFLEAIQANSTLWEEVVKDEATREALKLSTNLVYSLSALRAFRTDLKKGNIEINESTPPGQLQKYAGQTRLALLDKCKQAKKAEKEGKEDDKKSLREFLEAIQANPTLWKEVVKDEETREALRLSTSLAHIGMESPILKDPLYLEGIFSQIQAVRPPENPIKSLPKEENKGIIELKRNQLRNNANEILQTEKSYNKQLRAFQTFLTDVVKSKLVSDEDNKILQALLDSNEQVLRMSDELLLSIDNKKDENEILQGLVAFFSGGTSKELYCGLASAYINFEKGLKEIERLKKDNSKFSEACKEFSKDLNIDSFIIAPIQRGPRYGLLFKELIKNSNIPGAEWLHESVQEISSASDQMMASFAKS